MEERFTVKFAEKDELEKVLRFRYESIVMEYSTDNVKADGLDTSEYDEYARQAIAVDNETGEIVGCYRMILSDEIPKGRGFVCEEEFDIEKLKASGEKICEFSRAGVKKEYRGGVIILLLWRFILSYVLEHGYRYVVGDASFFGTDREKYLEELSYMANEVAIADEYEIHSKDGLPMLKFLQKGSYDEQEVKHRLPPLIRAYINMGARISKETYTDVPFKSVDVFVLTDAENCNMSYVKRLLRM